MSATSDNYADGGVHSLTMGSSELSSILQAAARRSQLVLVDFSASWCGPCRMMLPVLHQLATEHRGRLAVIKVDCEQTAANQGLAQSSGIRAFPTFHLFRAQQKVAELRGADPNGLRRAIQQQLALLGPAAGGSGAGASGASGGRGPMVTALSKALARVRMGCTYEEFVAAAKTLLTFVGNVLDHPGEDKYRRVKLANPAFQSKLGCRDGGKECMASIGFRELMEAGEAVLVLSEVPEELPRVRQLLQEALRQAEAGAAGAAAAERRSAAAAPPPAAAAAGLAAAPAAAGAGAGSSGGGATATTAGAGNVDPAALARALAAALGGTATTAAGTAAATAAAAPGAAGQAQQVAGQGAGRRRVPRITPAKLARALEKMMVDSGIGGTQQAQQAQQHQQHQP